MVYDLIFFVRCQINTVCCVVTNTKKKSADRKHSPNQTNTSVTLIRCCPWSSVCSCTLPDFNFAMKYSKKLALDLLQTFNSPT